MSKVDAQRAMREARYARLRASGPTRREAAAQAAPAPSDALVEEVPAASPAPAPKPRRTRAKKAASPAAPTEPEDALLPVETPAGAGLCGHTSMTGRTCTREAGHAEKSHRYG